MVLSNELKPHMEITIAAGTTVELVFDVNPKQFANRSGGYNVNPRQGMIFVESFRNEFGEIVAEIELPINVSEWLSIDVNLFRQGEDLPIWTTSLENGMLKFEINSLLPGEYYLEATLAVGELELILEAGPIIVKAGEIQEVTLLSKQQDD